MKISLMGISESLVYLTPIAVLVITVLAGDSN